MNDFYHGINNKLPPDKKRHDAALDAGCWQCPNCELGWQVYMINNDMHLCSVCGYTGGYTTRQKTARSDTQGDVK
jgi:rubredoxin